MKTACERSQTALEASIGTEVYATKEEQVHVLKDVVQGRKYNVCHDRRCIMTVSPL